MAMQEKGKGSRVVLVPCPLQGHLNPMLHLGIALYSRGFSITVIHTTFNSPNTSQYPHFDLKPISEGSSDMEACTSNPVDFASFLNTSCEEPFRRYMSQLVQESDREERVVCIISDMFTYFTKSVAEELHLPRFILWASSVNSFIATNAIPLLRQKGYLPIKDPTSEDPVEELPPFRVKDLLDMKAKDQGALYELFEHSINEAKHSSGVVWNSFDFLEEAAITKLQQDFGFPIFTIAPLHKRSVLPCPSIFLEQEASCMEWLNLQEPKSVIYVSFGSLASIEESQMMEIAWGLAGCKLPFVWVVRPGLVRGRADTNLPDDFKEEIKGRGLVVEWIHQREVLAHPAVGGFWTHCGWNSIVESICEGVPMLCWPCFGDQKVNARFVSHVWRMGIQLEDKLERGVVGTAIRRLMVEKEAEEIKERMKIFKEKAKHCQIEGDSFNRFVHYITSTTCSMLCANNVKIEEGTHTLAHVSVNSIDFNV